MIVWLDQKWVILQHIQKQIFCSIYYDVDFSSCKPLHNSLINIFRKCIGDASCKYKNISFLNLLQLFKQFPDCLRCNFRPLSVNLTLFTCINFYIDPRHSLFQSDKICRTSKIGQHLLQCISGKSCYKSKRPAFHTKICQYYRHIVSFAAGIYRLTRRPIDFPQCQIFYLDDII